MPASTHLPLLLLLAACPAGKDNTDGETMAGTSETSEASATGTTAGSDGAGTASSTSDATTGACAPVPCDQCEVGCVGHLVCIGSQATCECDCEDPGSPTTTTDATTGEPAIVCGGDMPYFPAFDRSCAATTDCALVLHQLDCCGSLAALGISGDAAPLFAAAEAECAMQYPDCDCLAQPTTADDGNSSPDINAIEVGCVDGQCRSFVP